MQNDCKAKSYQQIIKQGPCNMGMAQHEYSGATYHFPEISILYFAQCPRNTWSYFEHSKLPGLSSVSLVALKQTEI